MLLPPPPNYFAFRYDNWGANPSNTYGTSVVPGTSNAEGSWTQLASAANIAQDIYWFKIIVHSGTVTNNAKPQLLDIGVDPAGGSSYAAVISNLCVGQSQTPTSGGGYSFVFPLFIKAGSSVAARIQGAHATAGTVRVGAKFFGQPSRPSSVPVGFVSETVGAITNSGGVSITPGNAADGTWTLLGTTTLPCWWWQLAVQQDNSNTTALLYYFELAVGDGTNFHVMSRLNYSTTSTEAVLELTRGNMDSAHAYCPVPAGASLYCRGRCSAAPESGWTATAVGVC